MSELAAFDALVESVTRDQPTVRAKPSWVCEARAKKGGVVTFSVSDAPTARSILGGHVRVLVETIDKGDQ